MLERMLRAARLESSLYEEVEADPTAGGQALFIVVAVGLISALGMALAYPGDQSVGAVIANVISTVLSWVVWAFLTLWIGKTFLAGEETQSDMGEMLRTLGFAHTPQLLVGLVFIPVAGPVLALLGSLWKLVAGIVAIRQALDFSTSRAILTAFFGFMVVVVFRLVVRLIF